MKTFGRWLLLIVLVGVAFGVLFYERPLWVEQQETTLGSFCIECRATM